MADGAIRKPHFLFCLMAAALRDKAIQLFNQNFGERPSVFAYAPGRVNFIGDHTDYCEGFVCPLAIHLGTVVVGKLIPGTVRVPLLDLRVDLPCGFLQHGRSERVQWR